MENGLQSSTVRRTIVLGGGGVAGIAWSTGLLLGLAEHGADLRDADLLIGTSAGATVAAQICSGVGLDALYARQVDPALQAPEFAPADHLFDSFMERITDLIDADDAGGLIRGMGQLALNAQTVAETERRTVIEARLPCHLWPDRPLTIVAVDAHDGATFLIDRRSGVSLIDAVAASCAVPGVWPPVTIGSRRYIDGGVRSTDNADLARGSSHVIVISPRGSRTPFVTGRRLLDQLAELETCGAAVLMVEPDKASRTAIGRNPLAPETRPGSARAGLEQGRDLAREVASIWKS